MSLAKRLSFFSTPVEEKDKTVGVGETLVQTLRPIQKCRKNYIELSGLSEMLKRLLEEQGRHLESFSSAFNELAASADEISATNESVLSQAESSLKETEEGAAFITELKDVSNGLSAEQEELKKLIDVMRSIREATHLINTIVFQTKLLSFNASVEAARAGEHGKGFAVVAEEVKNLAESSKKAADSISQKIESGINTVDRLVNVLSQGIERVVKNAETTSKKFENIKGNVTGLTTSVREITAGVSNQSSAINSSLSVLHQFSELNQRNAQFTLVSVSEISSDLADSVETVSEFTKESLKQLNKDETDDDIFWENVDKILQQIRDQKDLLAALQLIAESVAEISSWKIAHVLTPDKNGVTASAGLWSTRDAKFRSSKFFEMSSEGQFESGKGLPGRVYKSKHFEYIENVVADTNFPRHKAAAEIHLVSGIGVPILSRDQRVVAVVEFFSFDMCEPDENLVEALKQMGQVAGAKSL